MKSAGAGTGQRWCELTAVCQPRRSPLALMFSLRYPGSLCTPQPPPLSPLLQLHSCSSCECRAAPGFAGTGSAATSAEGRISNAAGFPLIRPDGEWTKYGRDNEAILWGLESCVVFLWLQETLLFRIIVGDAVVAIITLQIHACMLTSDSACFAPHQPKNESRISPVLTGVPKRRQSMRELLKVKGLWFHCWSILA